MSTTYSQFSTDLHKTQNESYHIRGC